MKTNRFLVALSAFIAMALVSCGSSRQTGGNSSGSSSTRSASAYTITWKNWDGSILETDRGVAYGTTPSYDGATPTKATDSTYAYTFSGWSPEVRMVTGDATYTATFSQTASAFTVTWKNWDGSILETDENVPYGSVPDYNGETPTKASDGQYSYAFAGWDPDIKRVTCDATYTAQFSNSVNTYTVTWKNWDGAVLETDEGVEYGSAPTYDGETPTKASDGQYSYAFAGWDPDVSSVTGDATYTAQFSNSVNTYTVTWKNWDGAVLETDEGVEYGSAPTYDGETPTKANDTQYSYVFDGWAPAITPVVSDASYQATFSQTNRSSFTVSFDANGGIGAPDSQIKQRGNAIVIPSEVPTLEHHTFCGWNCVLSNKVFKAGDSFDIDADVTLFAMWCEHCHTCDGEGIVTSEHTCSSCSGRGTITTTSTTFTPCMSCRGEGSIIISYLTVCSSCGGFGGDALCECSCGYKWWANQTGSRKCSRCGQTVKARRITTCSKCGGSGTVKASSTSTCTACNGAGGWYKSSTKTCSTCSGKGTITTQTTCSSCHGDVLMLPDAPTILSYDHKSVTLVSKEGYEYSKDGQNWQTSNVFTGLSAVTKYDFYQRVATKDDKPFGITSKPVSVTTNSIPY